jgi:regulator of sirC expression with transglutaminase-like and TPR domain
MFSESKVKALIELIGKEPGFQDELKEQLAKVIKTQPERFRDFIDKDFGAVVPFYVKEVINTVHRENLGKPFKWYFERRNPPLMQGISLIARFVNPGIKESDVTASFNFFKENMETRTDNHFDIFNKAEAFESVIFGDYGFRVENLANDPKLLSLPDIIRTRKTTAFGMAVLYLLLAESFEILADITDVAGKPVVRFRDTISFEPVYIDIAAKGRFVSEDECHIYAAGRGLNWDSRVMQPFNNKQIIKRLLANLIYVYGREDGQNPAALNFLRKFLSYAGK